jgi:serine/threonine-protein kinase RsbW
VTDVVELSIPVQADLVTLARLTAATVASRAGFDVEEIEDLRLAVDELCLLAVEGGRDGRLELRFTSGVEEIEVSCTFEPGVGGSVPEFAEGPGDGLSGRILEALVDEHGEGHEGGRRRTWLRKRRARQQA